MFNARRVTLKAFRLETFEERAGHMEHGKGKRRDGSDWRNFGHGE